MIKAMDVQHCSGVARDRRQAYSIREVANENGDISIGFNHVLQGQGGVHGLSNIRPHRNLVWTPGGLECLGCPEAVDPAQA